MWAEDNLQDFQWLFCDPASHENALKNLRKKFSASWKKCGEYKKRGKTETLGKTIEQKWEWVVLRRLQAHEHHESSEILKELMRTREYERVKFEHQ